MRYYLDTEFLEGRQRVSLLGWTLGHTMPTIDLISIGIVAEDGREYYAISKEFNLREAWDRWQPRTGQGDRNQQEPREYWIRYHVLKPLYDEFIVDENYEQDPVTHKFDYWEMKYLLNKYGKTREQIAQEVFEFCNPKNPSDGDSWAAHLNKYRTLSAINTVEFYAYFADYDWVVFCWLFGKMVDLPKGFPYYCRDLKQQLDEAADRYYPRVPQSSVKTDHVHAYPHTFADKLKLVKAMKHYPTQHNEHNALEDARWNRHLHDFINSLK